MALEIVRRIARGGMAEVHLGVVRGLGGFARLVVQKRILPEVAREPQFERMFLDEARLAARLTHPGIVQILDVGRDAEGLFLIMEYLAGESLAYLFHHLRHAGERMPWQLACRVGAQLAAGLAAAHGASDATGRRRPIVHRDVTPSNVMLGWTGQVKLVDFGIARALAATRTIDGTVKGKLAYLPPEVIAGAPADPRSDIFQLGIVLHELMTGERLFDGASDAAKIEAIQRRRIARPSAMQREIPPAVDAVLLRALARDPAVRTGSAEEVRRDLEAALRTAGAAAGDAELSAWMTRRFAARLAERRRIEQTALIGATEPSAIEPSIGAQVTRPIAPAPPVWNRCTVLLSAGTAAPGGPPPPMPAPARPSIPWAVSWPGEPPAAPAAPVAPPALPVAPPSPPARPVRNGARPRRVFTGTLAGTLGVVLGVIAAWVVSPAAPGPPVRRPLRIPPVAGVARPIEVSPLPPSHGLATNPAPGPRPLVRRGAPIVVRRPATAPRRSPRSCRERRQASRDPARPLRDDRRLGTMRPGW